MSDNLSATMHGLPVPVSPRPRPPHEPSHRPHLYIDCQADGFSGGNYVTIPRLTTFLTRQSENGWGLNFKTNDGWDARFTNLWYPYNPGLHINVDVDFGSGFISVLTYTVPLPVPPITWYSGWRAWDQLIPDSVNYLAIYTYGPWSAFVRPYA